MKKLLQGLLAFMTVIALVAPTVVYAAGMSANRSSLTITAGAKGTFTVTASGCAGRIDISSDNAAVAVADVSSKWLDSTMGPKSVTVTVTGKSVGTAHIYVKNTDVATDGGADISGKVLTITVNVTAPVNYSSNNKFASFGVKDHPLEDQGNGNYFLTVRNAEDQIEIFATAEDAKATVSGTGVKDLAVGENKFEVVVTAENGSKNVRTITVVRKDGIYVEDIVEEIEAGNNHFEVIKDDDHEIPQATVAQIKGTGTALKVNEYDEQGNVLYYISVDGTALANDSAINLDVSLAKVAGMDEITGYMKGVCLTSNMQPIPAGVKIGLPVGDLCQDGVTVNVYRLNKETNQLELVASDLLVNNGVVELEGLNATDLFVTPGTYVAPVAEAPNAFHTCLWFFISLIAIVMNALQLVLKKKSRV